MVDYNVRAGEILGRLFQGERAAGDLESGLSIADIEGDISQFLAEVDLLRSIGSDFPAMNVAEGPPVPVSLLFHISGRAGPAWPIAGAPFWAYGRERLYDALRAVRTLGDRPPLPLETARNNFSSRAQAFLATRLAALGSRAAGGHPGSPPPLPPHMLNLPQFVGGPPAQVSGCHFSVKTNSPGLAAYWSGAYYISPNYLGSPTTPAVGVLQAGTYIFGINGGAYGSTVQWDTNKVCSLPGVPSVHLHY
jgi:hypothetical protein